MSLSSYSNPHSVVTAVTKPGRKKRKKKNKKWKTNLIDMSKITLNIIPERKAVTLIDFWKEVLA